MKRYNGGDVMKYQHSEIERARAYTRLCEVFGAEMERLIPIDVRNVCEDYLDAVCEDQCDAKEYWRRIGIGNLQAYADCLAVPAKTKEAASQNLNKGSD